MRALRVELTETLAYWTVVDDEYRSVPAADAFLRHLRMGLDRAEGTTRTYAGDLALYLGWCQTTGRDMEAGARGLAGFVGWLRITPVQRAGRGQGRPRSSSRINHVLAATREFYKHAVAEGELDSSVLTALYEVGDDRFLPAELRRDGSGVRYVARPRHRQRERRPGAPTAVSEREVVELLGVCRCWRDRFLLVLLWFCGLRIGEALGLRRSDLHLVPSATALGCGIPGPHLHVVARSNPNGAAAKSGGRHVPVPTQVLVCYEHYLAERGSHREADDCDFVFVNLFHLPVGQPMRDGTVREWLAAASRRAGLERVVTPHMFRHGTAGELLARGAGIDVVKELLGHASVRSTEAYLHPAVDTLRAAVDRLGPLDFRAGQRAK